MKALLPTVVAVTMVLGATPALAQVIPGYRDDYDASQLQFRAYAMAEFQGVLAEWIEAVNAGDARAAARLYTEDAFVHLDRPMNGEDAARASLEAWLDHVEGVRAGLSDFDASGNLAYGSARVQLEGAGSGGTVDGTMTFVMRRDGRTWKIRSQTLVVNTLSNRDS